MGSDSDLPVVKGAINSLKMFEIPIEVHVMSAHRTPELACEFEKKQLKKMKNFRLKYGGKCNTKKKVNYF